MSGTDAFAGRTRSLRDPARVRTALLAAVNRERKARKLPPLGSDSRLEAAAQRHAEDMLARGYSGHDAERAGENIATGQGSVEEVMKGWMKSREHRENILDPLFEEIGSGLALGKKPDGDPEVVWVQVFGRPAGH